MFEAKETDFLIYNVFSSYMLLLFVLFFHVASSYSLRISHFQTEGLPLLFFNIYSYFQASWLAVNSLFFFSGTSLLHVHLGKTDLLFL